MHMTDLMSLKDLARAIEDGLVKAQEDVSTGFLIYNYTARAMVLPGAWDNPAVRICRGLIVDPSNYDYRVVARPWEKFFGYGQAEAGDIDFSAPAEVSDKADGSLGIIYLSPGGLPRVATRGSFASNQAVWASMWLQDHPVLSNPNHLMDITYLVEIIYPENRIVLDYGNYEGLRLLGGVEIETGRYIGPSSDELGWDGDRTEVFSASTLAEALALPPRAGAEGMCVRFLDTNKIVKIKQDDYLKAHAYLTNCTPLQIWRKLGEGYILEDFLQEAPDEFVPLVTQYYTELIANMEDIRRRVNSEWDLLQQSLPEDPSRKQLADAAKSNPHSPALFMLADGKDIEPYLLKKVKPSALP